MLLGAEQRDAALIAARQLLQRSLLHQDTPADPRPEMCYAPLALVRLVRKLRLKMYRQLAPQTFGAGQSSPACHV